MAPHLQVPVVLTIAGSDCSAGAGAQAGPQPGPETGARPGPEQGAGKRGGEGDVVDAEFEVVDEDKKK